MGLFGSRKKVLVSSTVYNMAGDEANRANFMKSAMFAAVMNRENGYIGESLVQSHLTGPGINQRSLFNYAVRNDYPGLPTLSIKKSISIDPEVVRPFIEVPTFPSSQVVEIQNAYISSGDYEVFAEKHMNENFPDEINTNWVAEYNKDDHTITIQREGGATVTFSAGIYDSRERFLVANYYCQIPESVQTLVEGAKTIAVTGGLPSLTGFTLDSTSNTGLVTYTQNQTRTITREYSNGDPTTVDTDYPVTDTDFNTVLTVHTKTVYNGGDGLSPETTKTTTFRRVWEYREVYTSSSTTVVVNDIGGGHTETVTTEITGDFLRTVYDWQIDTQETILSQIVGGNKVFIYQIGSGNEILDALDEDVGSVTTAEFFPIIPIRLNNVSITDPQFEDLYESSKKLYKRATRRQKLDDLVEEVEDNEDLEEIDYAYIQWGVSLNTKEKEARKYIYEFWKQLIPFHGLPSDYMTTLTGFQESYEAALAALNAWIAAQDNPVNPLYGTPRPTIPSIGSPQVVTLRFVTDHPKLTDFDNRISFVYIDEMVFTGLGKEDAKKNDYWFVVEDPITWNTEIGVIGSAGSSLSSLYGNTMPVMSLYWQSDTNQYKRIKVYGAIHENFIYGGKAVTITSTEALEDTDESGFLIPLHYPSLKAAGLVSSTQLATSNTYIVFNSYKVYKKKWYQTFFGMLFLAIALAVIAALIAPSVIGNVSGVFGTNAALGASLGLSGTIAIVAGAAVNAIAAVLISTALQYGSVALFGEKWGALLASLFSFVFNFGLSGGFENLSTLFQPKNLLALSASLANGYSGFVRGSILEMQADMFEIQKSYEEEMDRIQELLAELMGNDLAFNPISLTDASRGNGSRTGSYLPESLDDFIQRTTLTGSDIVEMTLSVINDFADLSLTLPKT